MRRSAQHRAASHVPPSRRRCAARWPSPGPPGVPLGPNPRVGCVLLDADGRRGRRGVPPRRRPPARRGRGAPAPWAATRSGLTAVVTLEPCNHTGRTGPCARGPPRGRGRAGRVRPARPEPGRGGRRQRPCADAGVDVGGRAARRRGPRPQPGLDVRGRARPAVRHLEVRRLARRAQRRRRRHQPVGQQRRRAPRHPPAAGRVRRGAGRHRHRAGRRPAADRPRRERRAAAASSTSRCGRSWGCATVPDGQPGPRRRRRDRPPPHPRPRARRWPSCTPGAGATCSSRAARAWRPPSSGPGWSTRSSPTSRRCCSAAGAHAVEGLGDQHDRATRCASTSSTSTVLGDGRRPQRAAHHRRPATPAHRTPGPRRSDRCSPGSSRSSAPSSAGGPGRRGPAHRPRPAGRRGRRAGRLDRGQRRAASPSPSATARRFTADVMRETLAQDQPGRPRARRAGQPRARGDRRPRGSAATSSRATSTPPARSVAARPASTGRSSRSSFRRALAPYLVDEGVGHRRRDLADRRRRRRRPGDLHGLAHPRDPRPHHPRLPAARRAGQPRGRRDRQVRRAHARPQDRAAPDQEDAMSWEDKIRLDTVEDAIADIAAGKAGRRRRRRGPRERGRHHLRRQSRSTPGADGVHDPPQLRGHLRADAGRDARPARDPADDPAQQGPDAHGVHDLGRRPRRRDHRHQRRRPRPTPCKTLADSATEPWELTRPGSRVPAALPRGRGAGPPRPHRGGGRPGADGRADPGRRAGRGGQRRRHDEARAGAAGLRRRARAEADLDRADGPPPPAHREPRRAGRRDPAAHPVRGLHRVRLPDRDRRLRARRARVRRPGGPARAASRSSPGCTRSA